MVLYFNNINKIISKIYSIIIMLHIFNYIKAETTPESIDNNQIINRIIYIGDIYYRYMNFASYSNGDMVVETTCFPEERKRMFYGLKNNGRPFFTDKSNNMETPYYSINVTTENYKKLEATGKIIKLSNTEDNGKEYFFSISKKACNAELFDFDNDMVYTKYVNSFTTFTDLDSLRNTIFSLSDSNSEYYYIFGFSSQTYDGWHRFCLQKHKFDNLNDFSNTDTYNGESAISERAGSGSQISCFLTMKKLINCFYLTLFIDGTSYNIVKYGNDLQNITIFAFKSYIDDANTIFLKCIHLKEEVGVYTYYLYKDDSFYPSFLFKEFDSDNETFIDYLPSFEISKNNFLKNLLLNDLIKLTESRIVFSSVIEDKTIVYIILIDIFEDKKIKLRYYPLKLYETHHLKVLFDLRLHNFNNFTALGLSLCPTDECIFDNNTHYSTLMILNYPNSTDQTLYLDIYLYNNNITIDNIEIDFKEYLNFENNIFGYVSLKTSIKKISGCEDYKFYLSTNEEVEIKEGENLEGDEKIKIKYKGNDNFFPILSGCQIEYSFIATEPDLNIYDLYPEIKEGEDDLGFFERQNYTGRLSYYNIKLTKELSHTCQDINCDLCYKNTWDHCITCKFNFTISGNSENPFKQCLPETDLTTEQTTESLTEGATESLTERITNIFSEKETFLTQKPTEILTQKQTEIVTEKSTEILTQKQTEIAHEKTNEIINDETTEIITQKPTEIATEKTNEIINDETTEILTQNQTEISHDQKTEIVTQKETEVTTEKIIAVITQKPTETLTELLDEKASYIFTEKMTEQNLDKLTSPISFKITELLNQQISNVETIKKTDKPSEELINKNKCSKENILLNECKDGLIYEDQINDVYDEIKDTYLKGNYTGNNTINNTIIQTQNVIFQVSTVDDQKNQDNQNVSNIDLGICEEKLRFHYKIDDDDSLIIIKVDTKSEDLTQTYVQYQIYNPKDLSPLNLSICEGIQININTPVVLDNLTSYLYDKLKELGYNLFNKNDTFYSDICTTYTTENGTDIILSDRKSIIYSNNGNKTLCQNGCELESYNSTSKKASCKCWPQLNATSVSLSSISSNFVIRNIADSFLRTLKYSNFLVMKCYKLAFILKTISSNIGRIFMTIIIFISLIILIFFCFYDNKKIESFIKLILNIKLAQKKINQKKEIVEKKEKNIIKGEKMNIKKINVKNDKNNKAKVSRKKSQAKEKIKKIESPNRKKTSMKNKNDKNIKKGKDKEKEIFNKLKKKDKNNQKQKDKKSFPPKRKEVNYNKNRKDFDKYNLNNNSKSKLTLNEEDNKNKNLKTKNKNCKTNINIFNIGQLKIGKVAKNKCKEKSLNITLKNNYDHPKKIYKKSTKTAIYMNSSNNTFYKHNVGKNILYRNLNDEELNSLEYTIALSIDKRTYFQYYWSLLKKKHLILFTFYPNNDYNLPSIKIFLFLVSFSLYFTINGFFFNDDTMHKINEDHGNFNLLYQLPQIFYSSIVSAVINIILKQLSLSEKNILALKGEKNYNRALQCSKGIKKCLSIKFIIFFILSYLLLMFFWYFIACFCAVYVNTQIILIKDTLISFSLSMTYPFGLNLIPGFFRIPALRAVNQDKNFIYKISLIIGLII